MSGVAITVAIVVIICVSVIAIYIAQAREKARLEKIQKINAFNERHQKLQRLLHELPPQYLSDELRMLIVQKSIETLNRLLELKPSKRFEADLLADEEYLTNLQSNKLKLQPVKVNDPEKAKEVRSMLETLFKFVQTQAKQRQLDPGRAKQYLQHISYAAAKSRADGLVDKAEHALKAGKPRVAIHAYHTAIEAFKNIKDSPKAAQDVAEYRQRIKALEQDADKHNQEVKAKAQAKIEGNDQWNEFLGDEGEWKKKNAYDD